LLGIQKLVVVPTERGKGADEGHADIERLCLLLGRFQCPQRPSLGLASCRGLLEGRSTAERELPSLHCPHPKAPEQMQQAIVKGGAEK